MQAAVGPLQAPVEGEEGRSVLLMCGNAGVQLQAASLVLSCISCVNVTVCYCYST